MKVVEVEGVVDIVGEEFSEVDVLLVVVLLVIVVIVVVLLDEESEVEELLELVEIVPIRLSTRFRNGCPFG